MGLVPSIRSFIDSLWAVAAELAKEHAAGASGARSSRRKTLGQQRRAAVEASRVSTSLRWLRAFLRRWLGRTVGIRDWNGESTLTLTCDASPWGLGATLARGGRLVACLHDSISLEDADRLGIVVGSCKSQAIVEALAVVVALRTWLPTWGVHRTRIVVRSDSSAALGALGKLASPCRAINRIAREVGLDIALSTYGVDAWEHVRGAENTLADYLSRLCEPGCRASTPDGLRGVPG